MGFFKDVGNFVSNAAKGNFKDAAGNVLNAVGINTGSGGGSGGSSAHTDAIFVAMDVVRDAYREQRFQYYISQGMNVRDASKAAARDMGAYMATPAAQTKVTQVQGQVSSGSSPKGSTVGGILKDVGTQALNTIVEGTTKAVVKNVENGINTVAQNLGASSGAKSLKETLSGWLGGVGSDTLKDILKKNWWIIPIALIPCGFVIYVVIKALLKLMSGSKSKSSGKKSGFRTR